jgi:hypothetical protein
VFLPLAPGAVTANLLTRASHFAFWRRKQQYFKNNSSSWAHFIEQLFSFEYYSLQRHERSTQDKPVYILQEIIMRKQTGLLPSRHQTMLLTPVIPIKSHWLFHAFFNPVMTGEKPCFALHDNFA